MQQERFRCPCDSEANKLGAVYLAPESLHYSGDRRLLDADLGDAADRSKSFAPRRKKLKKEEERCRRGEGDGEDGSGLKERRKERDRDARRE